LAQNDFSHVNRFNGKEDKLRNSREKTDAYLMAIRKEDFKTLVAIEKVFSYGSSPQVSIFDYFVHHTLSLVDIFSMVPLAEARKRITLDPERHLYHIVTLRLRPILLGFEILEIDTQHL
ncbi:hypothetical protein BgiMline_032297, partial [Biomphalaria glabrata]